MSLSASKSVISQETVVIANGSLNPIEIELEQPQLEEVAIQLEPIERPNHNERAHPIVAPMAFFSSFGDLLLGSFR